MIDLDEDSIARRELSERPLQDRLADVCPGCGHHILDTKDRLKWLKEGGSIRCSGCGLSKTR
jgi:hypothetical protein